MLGPHTPMNPSSEISSFSSRGFSFSLKYSCYGGQSHTPISPYTQPLLFQIILHFNQRASVLGPAGKGMSPDLPWFRSGSLWHRSLEVPGNELGVGYLWPWQKTLFLLAVPLASCLVYLTQLQVKALCELGHFGQWHAWSFQTHFYGFSRFAMKNSTYMVPNLV